MWGPWQIIVEKIPLFEGQFFELFSAQALIQDYAWIAPPPCEVCIPVFVSLCDRAWGSGTAVEFEYTNAIW